MKLYRQRGFLLIFLILLCAVILGATAFFIQTDNDRIIRNHLDELTNLLARQIGERITTYEYGLRGARGATIGAGVTGINRERFHQYFLSRDQNREFPGSRGFGYIQRVPQSQEEVFIQRMRTEDIPDFVVKQLSPGNGERFVIIYVEPEELNRQAIGLDIASDEARRTAALKAMDTGQVVITSPLTLVQATGKPLGGLLMLLPVYRYGTTPQTHADRTAETVGWTFTPIVIEEVLQSLQLKEDEYYLTLYDSSNAVDSDKGVRFFSSAKTQTNDSPDVSNKDTLRNIVYLPLYSRIWVVEVTASQMFIKKLNLQNPWLLSSGLSLIALLCGMLLIKSMQNAERKKQTYHEREQMALLVENSSDAIIGHTKTGIISSWNHGAELLFGHRAIEAVGQSFSSLIISEDLQEEEAIHLSAVNAGQRLSSFSTKCATREGAIIDVSMTLSPIRTPAGSVIGATRTIRDLGEEKSFEAKLIALNAALEKQVSERTFALDERNRQLELSNKGILKIIESSPYALVLVDASGIITVFNAMAEQIFGYRRQEILGGKIEQLLPDRYWTRHEGFRLDFLKQPSPRAMGQGRELFAITKDGTEFPVEIGLSPMETVSGSFVLAAIIDITIRKNQELLIQRYSAFQQTILSNAGFAIITTDPDGIITLFNPSAERLLGYTASEILGKVSPAIFHLESEIESRARELSLELQSEISVGFDVFIAKARLGQQDENEWTYVRKDGTLLPVLLNVNVLRDTQDKIIGFLGIAADLTERNETAQKLKDYSDRLQRDLQLAADIQNSLLPQVAPETDRYDIAMYAKPARFVSGDVYDILAPDPDHVFLFLADISGKGIPAALLTSEARTLFKQGIKQSDSPTVILEIIDAILADDLSRGELFMTCQICLLDYRSGSLVYANAGHTETLVFRQETRNFESFIPTNIPVGIKLPTTKNSLGDCFIPVKPGDIIVFYSDGLTEMSDARETQFGVDRLRLTIQDYADTTSDTLIQRILQNLHKFSQDQEAEDDVSIIVTRIQPATISSEWKFPLMDLEKTILSIVAPCRGYSERFVYELDLIVTELITNIVRHAYGFSLTADAAHVPELIILETSLYLNETEIILDVYDEGRPFPDEGKKQNATDSLAEGGFGLQVIRRLSDQIQYRRESERNHWHLTKKTKESLR